MFQPNKTITESVTASLLTRILSISGSLSQSQSKSAPSASQLTRTMTTSAALTASDPTASASTSITASVSITHSSSLSDSVYAVRIYPSAISTDDPLRGPSEYFPFYISLGIILAGFLAAAIMYGYSQRGYFWLYKEVAIRLIVGEEAYAPRREARRAAEMAERRAAAEQLRQKAIDNSRSASSYAESAATTRRRRQRGRTEKDRGGDGVRYAASAGSHSFGGYASYGGDHNQPLLGGRAEGDSDGGSSSYPQDNEGDGDMTDVTVRRGAPPTDPYSGEPTGEEGPLLYSRYPLFNLHSPPPRPVRSRAHYDASEVSKAAEAQAALLDKWANGEAAAAPTTTSAPTNGNNEDPSSPEEGRGEEKAPLIVDTAAGGQSGAAVGGEREGEGEHHAGDATEMRSIPPPASGGDGAANTSAVSAFVAENAVSVAGGNGAAEMHYSKSANIEASAAATEERRVGAIAINNGIAASPTNFVPAAASHVYREDDEEAGTHDDGNCGATERGGEATFARNSEASAFGGTHATSALDASALVPVPASPTIVPSLSKVVYVSDSPAKGPQRRRLMLQGIIEPEGRGTTIGRSVGSSASYREDEDEHDHGTIGHQDGSARAVGGVASSRGSVVGDSQTRRPIITVTNSADTYNEEAGDGIKGEEHTATAGAFDASSAGTPAKKRGYSGYRAPPFLKDIPSAGGIKATTVKATPPKTASTSAYTRPSEGGAGATSAFTGGDEEEDDERDGDAASLWSAATHVSLPPTEEADGEYGGGEGAKRSYRPPSQLHSPPRDGPPISSFSGRRQLAEILGTAANTIHASDGGQGLAGPAAAPTVGHIPPSSPLHQPPSRRRPSGATARRINLDDV